MNQVAIDRAETDVLLIRLAGQWELRHGLASTGAVESELQQERRPSRIAFDTHELGLWDSSILTFLARVSSVCRERGVTLDGAGLPAGLHNLLKKQTCFFDISRTIIQDLGIAPLRPETWRHRAVYGLRAKPIRDTDRSE